MTKKQEKLIRKELSALKKRIKKQDRENIKFAKTKCKTLLKALHSRWDYEMSNLFEYDVYTPTRCLIHDLRDL